MSGGGGGGEGGGGRSWRAAKSSRISPEDPTEEGLQGLRAGHARRGVRTLASLGFEGKLENVRGVGQRGVLRSMELARGCSTLPWRRPSLPRRQGSAFEAHGRRARCERVRRRRVSRAIARARGPVRYALLRRELGPRDARSAPAVRSPVLRAHARQGRRSRGARPSPETSVTWRVGRARGPSALIASAKRRRASRKRRLHVSAQFMSQSAETACAPSVLSPTAPSRACASRPRARERRDDVRGARLGVHGNLRAERRGEEPQRGLCGSGSPATTLLNVAAPRSGPSAGIASSRRDERPATREGPALLLDAPSTACAWTPPRGTRLASCLWGIRRRRRRRRRDAPRRESRGGAGEESPARPR